MPHYTYLEIEWNWYESLKRYSHWIFALHQFVQTNKTVCLRRKTNICVHSPQKHCAGDCGFYNHLEHKTLLPAPIRWFFLQLSKSFQSVEWPLNNCGSHSHFMPYIFWGGRGKNIKSKRLDIDGEKTHSQNHQQKYHGWLNAPQKMVEASMSHRPQNFHVQVKSTGNFTWDVNSGQMFCELKWTKINLNDPADTSTAQRKRTPRPNLGSCSWDGSKMQSSNLFEIHQNTILNSLRQTSTCMNSSPRESLFHEMRAKRSQEALLAMECLQAKWSLNRSMR